MQKRYLEAGKIVNTHGIRGEVKVEPWADGPEFLLNFDTVYLAGQPVAVEHVRVQKSMVLMKLAGIDTVESAAALRGKVLSIDREDIQLDENTVFIADLIGLPVFSDADGAQIGVIEEVLTPPANDVYVVKGEHSYMIPVVKEFVLQVDVQSGVTVHLLEGMQTDAD